MKLHYTFSYNFDDAQASIEIETTLLSRSEAKQALINANVDVDDNADFYLELAKKCSLLAMHHATTFYTPTLENVIKAFNSPKSIIKVDGTQGVLLTQVSGIDFTQVDIDNLVTP